jgi:hypothetical protein
MEKDPCLDEQTALFNAELVVGTYLYTQPSDYYGDILGVAKNELLMFVNWNGMMRAWEGKVLEEHPKGFQATSISKGPVFTIDTWWHEPFAVIGDRTECYFVTSSGKLYCWEKPGRKEQKMTAVWTSVSRPIRALIIDTESKRTWAFTAPSRSRPSVCFEVKPAVRPEMYTPEKLLDAKLPDTYRSAAAHVRFLQSKQHLRTGTEK